MPDIADEHVASAELMLAQNEELERTIHNLKLNNEMLQKRVNELEKRLIAIYVPAK